MEENEDIAAPDLDTIAVPIATPHPTPEATPAPTTNETALEDAETARVAIVAPTNAPAEADTVYGYNASVAPTAPVSDPADVATVRVPAVAASDPTMQDTLVETPAVLMPAVKAPAAAQAKKPFRGGLAHMVWLRYPEFWIAVALAAVLRLWRIDLISFVGDQAALMRLARGAWLHGALPVTSNISSFGTANPPLAVYLLAPFALFGKNPLPAAISIALWNVLGVALCYIFAHRYFGRTIAASGALLLASCGAAVDLSRSIWQPGYLPPVLALWILTLFLGAVTGRRGWFAPHVALLTIAILLHSGAALLIPVSLVGFLLTPRSATPSRREWALAVGLVALLLAPSVLWLVVDQGSDFGILAQYLGQHGAFDLDVFRKLYASLGAPAVDTFGPNALYAQMGIWATVLNIVVTLAFVAGMIVLTERLVRVGVYVWREGATTTTGQKSSMRGGAVAVWRGLRAEATWRGHLLLWLWVVVPVLPLLWHAGPLGVHDLVVIYPGVFIVGGFAFQAVFRRAGTLTSRRAVTRRLARTVVLALLALLVLAQSFQYMLFAVTPSTGSFNALSSYGYPLAEAQQLDAALGSIQAEQNARSIFLSLPQDTRYQSSLAYLTISEHPSRVGSAANCLIFPAPDEEPALVVATLPAGPANTMISSLPQLRLVANLSMAGSDPLSVYQLDGTLPPLLGERALTPVAFADAAGNGLRLDAVAVQTDGMLRLRWTVLGSDAADHSALRYHIAPSIRTSSGSTRALPATDCHPTRWHAGETVFTWIYAGTTTDAQALLLQVRASAQTDVLHTGPALLLAGRPASALPRLLRPSSGAVASDGTLTIPMNETP